MKSFASDNYAGVLPEVMEALSRANTDHAGSYGNDPDTQRVTALFREVFGADVDVFFVFNGTGANVLSISAATRSFNSVLCADISHIYNDESSAPETFTGCRFFPLPTNEQGKLEPATVAQRLIRKGDLHYPQISMLSLTQSTEYGSVYSAAEIRSMQHCVKNTDFTCMWTAPVFNAVSSLRADLKAISTDAGVDILSLGGTKTGIMYGEAVVVFNKQLAEHIRYKHKQVMQLASKTRFIAVQFEALFKGELWRRTASHANEMAQLLASALRQFPAVTITRPVQANVVFAKIPPEWNEPLMAQFPFYVWREDLNEVRLMCAWDTRSEDVNAFAAAVRSLAL